MAALTHAAEYEAVREAIQALTTTGQSVVSVNVDGMSVTYQASQLDWLEKREQTLARRLTVRNTRKRVTPDFTGSSSTSYLDL